MKLFEINDSSLLNGFDQIGDILFLDFWRAPAPDKLLGACRGLIVSGSKISLLLTSTWTMLKGELLERANNDPDNYRAGEIFGWQLKALPAECDDPTSLARQIPEINGHDILSYKVAFGDMFLIQNLKFTFTATAPDLSDGLLINCYDLMPDDGIVLASRPEGTLNCYRGNYGDSIQI